MGFSPDLAWAHTLRHLGLSWDGWGDDLVSSNGPSTTTCLGGSAPMDEHGS